MNAPISFIASYLTQIHRHLQSKRSKSEIHTQTFEIDMRQTEAGNFI